MINYKTNKAVAANSNFDRADIGGKSIVESINEITANQTRLNNLAKELEMHLAAKSQKKDDTDMANFYQEFPIIEAFVRQEIFENGKYYRINTRSAVALAKFFFMAGIKWNTGEKSLKNILKWK